MKAIIKALKFMWKNNKVWLLVTAATLVVLLVVSLLMTQVTLFRNTFNTFFGDYRMTFVGSKPEYVRYHPDEKLTSKTDALNAANALNERITEEGFVLLKNENNALPIKEQGKKISIFGKNSVNLVYGGSGSGGMSADNASTIHGSLETAGFAVNNVLKDFYNSAASGSGREKAPGMGAIPSGLAIGETSVQSYPQAVKESYNSFGDAALVVFSRIGGEGFDLPRTMKNSDGSAKEGANAEDHYLELDNNEKALLAHVCESFEKTIVIINSSTSMELGFLYDYSYDIDAAIWIGNPGKEGINSLGKIINGSVNPSGKLIDTYARDFESNPTWKNFSNNSVARGNEYTVNSGGKEEYFVDYEESIYIGYRYYETRGFTDGDKWYNDNIVYPFGYGLSYTEFSFNSINIESEDGTKLNTGDAIDNIDLLKIEVDISNTGSEYSGKEVAQLYFSAPYKGAGGIEKPNVVLADYAKTEEINPQNTDTVSLEIKVSDMASYDYSGTVKSDYTGYVLESGEYTIYIGKDAHDAWNGSDSFGVTFKVENDIFYEVDAVTGEKVENRFDDVNEYVDTRFDRHLSRADWDGTYPTTPTSVDKEVTNDFISSLKEDAYIGSGKNLDKGKGWYQAKKPVYSTKEISESEAVQLHELIGKPYDDQLWDKLVQQLTLSQMATLIGTGNFNTAAITNIGKPRTVDPDGPAGFVNFMALGSAAPVYDTCFYASECVIGATWNKTLAYEMGIAIGNEALFGNERGDGSPYSGWYAPAVNIHRSPFSGRNFEYYSEDPLLSGMMGANVVKGANEKGVYTYVKHFALNDQETSRGGICTWASEQTMREIYLRAFEIVVKVGETKAMMSSFNRIGTVWAGGSYELLTEVLRNEWGFEGMVISDYNTYPHMPANQMIRAGGDLNLIQDKKPDIKGNAVNASHIAAMQKATKNILYTVANSNAMNGLGDGVRIVYRLPIWMIVLILINVAFILAFAVWGFFAIRKSLIKSRSS